MAGKRDFARVKRVIMVYEFDDETFDVICHELGTPGVDTPIKGGDERQVVEYVQSVLIEEL